MFRPDPHPDSTSHSLNDTQPPAHLVAGALAHLARHMETGCERSAYLAAMLLERVACDPQANEHLRGHARELADILDREKRPTPPPQTASLAGEKKPIGHSGIFMGMF